MSLNLSVALALVFGFLIGAVPFGYLLASMKGVDIRSQGSGNIGATNVRRALGNKLGGITLLLDATKGIVAIVLAKYLLSGVDLSLVPLAGAMAVAGHCFSPFLAFKGGKGVATALGVFAVLAPLATLIGIGIFAGILAWKRYVALASISAAVSVSSIVLVGIPAGYTTPTIISCVIVAALIVIRHQGNIRRIKAGTERAI